MTDSALPILPVLRMPAEPLVPPLDALMLASGSAFMGVFDPNGGSRDAGSLRAAIARAERLLASADAVADQLREAAEVESVDEIKRQLGRFGFAWPNVSKADLAGYGAALLLDIADRQPSRYALASALRHLRQTSHWLPSIAEVLQALDAAQARIKNTSFHVRETPAYLAQARVDLAQAEAREAREGGASPSGGRAS